MFLSMNTLYVIGAIFIGLVLIYLIFTKLKKGINLSSFGDSQKIEILEIRTPKLDEAHSDLLLSPLSAENMFASLHGLLREEANLQEHFSFEISSTIAEGIKFYVGAPANTIRFLESQLYAQYPTSQLRIVDDYTTRPVEDNFFEVSNIKLQKPYYFPIKTFRDFESDPLSALTSALAEVGEGETFWFQVIAKPIPDVWQNAGYEYVNSVREGTFKPSSEGILGGVLKIVSNELIELGSAMLVSAFRNPNALDKYGKPIVPGAKPTTPVRLTPTQDLEMKAIENKLSKMGFKVQIRLVSSAKTRERMYSNFRSVVASMKQFSTATTNSFNNEIDPDRNLSLEKYKARAFDENKTFIINVEELATVYHLPSPKVETPNISWIYSKKSEPPPTLPTKDCTFIGETLFRSTKVRFGVANGDDRLRHMYLIGKSGTGKSTLLETMISQDIKNGFGVGVLDPHGETIDKVLNRIPDERVQDVIYFDPSDTTKPLGLNLLEMDDPGQKNLMASALLAAIKHHFDYSWGPRLEYLLNYSILTLLEVPGTSMLGITRLLEDDNYRKYILHFVKDPLVVRFWEREYKDMKGNQKLVTEAIAPIQNKVNRFLASTTIRNILGQKKSTVNIWDAMNSGKILLMNLSKGKIGSDNANLLGALLVSRIQFMALQRAKIPYDQRRPFYLYVDEFQNFATGSFEEILSESRKYGLGLYLTHQFTGQLPEELLKAVFGNVGTIATFSLGAPDANILAGEFAPYFDENDIISLERFQIYIKLMIDGMTSLPFSAKILLPWVEETCMAPRTGNREKVMEFSRNKYGMDSNLVEEKINRWVETPFDKGMALAQESRDKQLLNPSLNPAPVQNQ